MNYFLLLNNNFNKFFPIYRDSLKLNLSLFLPLYIDRVKVDTNADADNADNADINEIFREKDKLLDKM